ncbi:MAG TPA: methionyl-tRNA formyltransferase [Candidatus Acidoferrales bacterium]|nr:methionyl-tRNA formyltransferase [Candidatus Acidoferrales bacterium]
MPLRIIFCGTPEFALPSLRHLLAQPDFQIAGVVTQPDRPRGRGHATSSSPVKEAAVSARVPVYQPEKIKSDEALEYFTRTGPDAVVIIAYGQIVPQRLIEIPRLGWINLHGSLLPKYRGAAPIHRAIINGETRTGLTTMRIDAGLDTGPTLLNFETEIGPDETAPQLYARLSEAGAPLVAETLRALDRGTIVPTAQDTSLASFAPPLKKEEGRIDWSLPAQQIYNRIRGLQPWPGAFTSFRGKNCVIWGRPVSKADSAAGTTRPPGEILASGGNVSVACGEGTALKLEFVQLEGRKRITALEFANGARLRPGDRFGE